MSVYEQYKVNVPDGVSGDWTVERFTVPDEPTIAGLRAALDGHGVPPGDYTRLIRGGIFPETIMSDTPWEIRTNAPILRAMEHPECRAVLLMGLGIGMVLQHAIKQPHLTQIDVIEQSPDVIKLVGPTYTHDARVSILEADALEFRPDRYAFYDAIWIDIFDGICADNLPQIKKLKARWRKNCVWCAAWSQPELTGRNDRSFATALASRQGDGLVAKWAKQAAT
jgi:hypothetical protein